MGSSILYCKSNGINCLTLQPRPTPAPVCPVHHDGLYPQTVSQNNPPFLPEVAFVLHFVTTVRELTGAECLGPSLAVLEVAEGRELMQSLAEDARRPRAATVVQHLSLRWTGSMCELSGKQMELCLLSSVLPGHQPSHAGTQKVLCAEPFSVVPTTQAHMKGPSEADTQQAWLERPLCHMSQEDRALAPCAWLLESREGEEGGATCPAVVTHPRSSAWEIRNQPEMVLGLLTLTR